MGGVYVTSMADVDEVQWDVVTLVCSFNLGKDLVVQRAVSLLWKAVRPSVMLPRCDSSWGNASVEVLDRKWAWFRQMLTADEDFKKLSRLIKCLCLLFTVECFENRQLYFANRLSDAMKVRFTVCPPLENRWNTFSWELLVRTILNCFT